MTTIIKKFYEKLLEAFKTFGGLKMSNIVFHNKKDIEEYDVYGCNNVCIHCWVNHKLLEEVKTWKREFTPEFKAWYINMMGTCNNRLLLDSDKNKNEWWFRPALKIAHPEIQTFDGELL